MLRERLVGDRLHGCTFTFLGHFRHNAIAPSDIDSMEPCLKPCLLSCQVLRAMHSLRSSMPCVHMQLPIAPLLASSESTPQPTWASLKVVTLKGQKVAI